MTLKYHLWMYLATEFSPLVCIFIGNKYRRMMSHAEQNKKCHVTRRFFDHETRERGKAGRRQSGGDRAACRVPVGRACRGSVRPRHRGRRGRRAPDGGG